MKAVTYRRYGGPEVIRISEVRKPVPKANQVLIRVMASTVSSADWRARSLALPPGFGRFGRLVFGITGPRRPILGTEVSGVIDTVGPGVTRYRQGDAVIAFTGGQFGGHAEYLVMDEDGTITAKPANLGFAEAAALSFGTMAALPFLRDKAKVQCGEKVIVVGASGAVGTASVQIARHFGAKVTAVTSAPNLALVESIGASRVLDSAKVDFTRTGERWDVIVDTTGTLTAERCAQSLAAGGRLVAIAGSFSQWLGFGKPPKQSGRTVITGVAKVRADDLAFIADLAAQGIIRPVIDRIYRLDQVREAHAYVATGRKRGSVVLDIGDDTRGKR